MIKQQSNWSFLKPEKENTENMDQIIQVFVFANFLGWKLNITKVSAVITLHAVKHQ